jgi:transmembrane sensor
VEEEINWNLLAKYFAGETSTTENKKVEAWKALNEDNKKIIKQSYYAWELVQVNRIDEREAWEKIERKLGKQKTKIIFFRPIFYKIAASLLLIFAVLYSLNERTNSSTIANEFTTVESNNESLRIVLDDASIVHLNKNTKFKYPKSFNGKNREVFIDGEGFFEVTKNANMPFIVSTANLKIKVVGTSFNVEAFSSKPIAKVTVKTGKVSVTEHNRKTKNHLLLSKNEMATLDIVEGTLSKSSLVNNNNLAWKTGILIFNQIKLDEVVKTINKVYDTKIIFNNDDPKSCLLTAQFNNRPVEEVLDVLATTFKLKVEWTSTKIILYGKSCE